MTLILRRMSDGDRSAGEELFEVLYAELRARAGRLMGDAVGSHTLQPTAVVNEAWMKLSEGASDWESRGHFLGVAAKAMRSILVDHARAKKTTKRGGGADRVQLDDAVAAYESRAMDLVTLDDALARLAEADADLAQIVELRFFGGLTISEAAKVMQVSTPTIERGWRTARTLLRVELGEEGADGSEELAPDS